MAPARAPRRVGHGVNRAFVVALLGAESTGKTALARELGTLLAARGEPAGVVSEYLREFCDAHGRTPLREEQAAIAAEQSRRIDVAAAGDAGVVIADTTALMIAVYSDHVFADTSLYASAEALQRGIDLTLLTALDLPWRPDGLQRDGEHVREPIDALVRAALARASVPFTAIAGSGPSRTAAALAAIDATRCRRAA